MLGPSVGAQAGKMRFNCRFDFAETIEVFVTVTLGGVSILTTLRDASGQCVWVIY